jgi:hypothetical protein
MPTRFLTCAAPWHAIGANVIPIFPGGKKPLVAGWGRSGELAGRWCGVRAPLHSPDSPRLPWDFYRWAASQWPDANAAVLPGSIDCTVIDVDDLAQLPAVLDACGPTPYRTLTRRGCHLWYRGASASRNALAPGVDVKSIGAYVLAPGSLHPSGSEYAAGPELVDALARGVAPGA